MSLLTLYVPARAGIFFTVDEGGCATQDGRDCRLYWSLRAGTLIADSVDLR